MKTKHTPGPWHVDGFNLTAVIHQIGHTRWETLCDCSTKGKDIEERKANAKLIAAAPDLLEAAIHAVKALEKLNSGDDGYQAMIELEQAIKRATE